MGIENNHGKTAAATIEGRFRPLRNPANRGCAIVAGRWRYVWLVLLIGAIGVTPVSGQERSDMPWFDDATGELVPIGLDHRRAAESDQRSAVPVQAPRNRNWNSWNGPNFNLSSIFDLSGAAAWVVWGGGVVLVLLLAALLAWVLWRYRAFFERQNEVEIAEPRRTMAESIQQLPFDMPTRTGNFRELAWQAYQRGELQLAVVYLFSHVLVALDQRGMIRLKKGKTNRQYLSELPTSGMLPDYYRRAMLQFEKTFFGDHEVQAGEFEQQWNQLDRFESALAERRIHPDAS